MARSFELDHVQDDDDHYESEDEENHEDSEDENVDEVEGVGILEAATASENDGDDDEGGGTGRGGAGHLFADDSSPVSDNVTGERQVFSFPFTRSGLRARTTNKLAGEYRFSAAALQTLELACQAFWVNAAEDLAAYARHGGNTRITRKHVELLAQRQRLPATMGLPSLDDVIRAKAGYELRGMLVPIARATPSFSSPGRNTLPG